MAISEYQLKYCIVETRKGFVALASRNGRLARSTLPRPTRQEALAALNAGLTAAAVEDEAAFGKLPEMITRYFEGRRADFSDVPLDLDWCGAFSSAVLLAAQRIPYGTVVTYGELAGLAGSPGAARAAGSAVARNRVPIIVPCHRVIAAGGRIGGFSSGLEWKRELLKLEGVKI